jgi:hypothetical protein
MVVLTNRQASNHIGLGLTLTKGPKPNPNQGTKIYLNLTKHASASGSASGQVGDGGDGQDSGKRHGLNPHAPMVLQTQRRKGSSASRSMSRHQWWSNSGCVMVEERKRAESTCGARGNEKTEPALGLTMPVLIGCRWTF